jgi:hypothetical protein
MQSRKTQIHDLRPTRSAICFIEWFQLSSTDSSVNAHGCHRRGRIKDRYLASRARVPGSLIKDHLATFLLYFATDMNKLRLPIVLFPTPCTFIDDIAWQPHAHSGRSCARKPHRKRSTAASLIPLFARADVVLSYFDLKIIGRCNKIPSSVMFPASQTQDLDGEQNCLVEWRR